jgi:hypothetical protein
MAKGMVEDVVVAIEEEEDDLLQAMAELILRPSHEL